VRHGDHVAQGQLLATLRNTDLDVSITDTTGQLAASHEQLTSVERSLFEDGKRLSIEERNRLSGDRDECRQRIASLNSQLVLLQTKRTKLEVRSPIDGEVTTWNLDELLRDRPVKQGQILMSVADMAGPWELELRVPEGRIGCVAQAQKTLGNALSVDYHLATDPETTLEGRVDDVHLAAEVHGDDGNTVMVRVAVDRDALPHRQLGADCRASIHCGRRALGYVLFRDVVAFIHSRILFRI
jgi:multidrug efflux pump subunit AcrA (membrane-fusion protein)